MTALRGTRARRAAFLGVVALCVAVTSVGVALVRTVGLQYDEALFVNGALDSETTQFVSRRFGPVPILLMDYIGALKAWIYAPIFAVFGASIESIRIPMILLLGATIALAARLLWTRGGPAVAVLGAALLATEPTFALMARNDWGPVAIAGFLRVALAVALVAAVTTGRRRWFVAIAAITAIGIFNKLDFAIGSIALLVAAIIVLAPHWHALIRARPGRVIAGASALVAVYAAAGILLVLPVSGQVNAIGATLAERLDQRGRLVVDTFAGSPLIGYLTGGQIPVTSIALPGAIAGTVLVVVIAGAARLIGRAPRRPPAPEIGLARLTALFAVAAVAILIGFVAVGEVGGPHHAATLWPFPWLALASGVGALATIHRERILPVAVGVGSLVVAAIVVSGVLVSQIAVNVGYASLLAGNLDRPPIWTLDTESASDAVEAEGAAAGPIVFGDWGLANQFVAFDDRDPAAPILDIWPTVVYQDPGDVLAAAGLVGDFTLVYHDTDSQITPGSTAASHGVVRECLSRGGESTVIFRGDDVIVRSVSCPAGPTEG